MLITFCIWTSVCLPVSRGPWWNGYILVFQLRKLKFREVKWLA
jgi:hypothetical protein